MRKVEYVVRDKVTGTTFRTTSYAIATKPGYKIIKTDLVKCEDSDERGE